MSRTRVRDQEQPANPNAEAGEGTGVNATPTDADEGEDLVKPEKITKRVARTASGAGMRLCKTTATLRRLGDDGKAVDVGPGTELELTEDEFRHFHSTGCVVEVF